jgi:hypothetical protein
LVPSCSYSSARASPLRGIVGFGFGSENNCIQDGALAHLLSGSGSQRFLRRSQSSSWFTRRLQVDIPFIIQLNDFAFDSVA